MQLLNLLVKDFDQVSFDAAGQTDVMDISKCQTVAVQAVCEEIATVTNCTLTLQTALDSAGPWFDVSSAQTFDNTETDYLFSLTNPTGRYLAIAVALDSGEVGVTVKVLGKGMV